RDDLEQRVGRVRPQNYFGHCCRVILENRQRPAWWVESRAAEEATVIEQSLGRWLWILETIVTAAPLLDLLGTITGKIRAFHLFGSEGLVDPRRVTGGASAASVATSAGLLLAPAALSAQTREAQRNVEPEVAAKPRPAPSPASEAGPSVSSSVTVPETVAPSGSAGPQTGATVPAQAPTSAATSSVPGSAIVGPSDGG